MIPSEVTYYPERYLLVINEFALKTMVTKRKRT
jgi:hypothetical protein